MADSASISLQASADLKSLELLFDYTKFHIGLYLTLASGFDHRVLSGQNPGYTDACYPEILINLVRQPPMSLSVRWIKAPTSTRVMTSCCVLIGVAFGVLAYHFNLVTDNPRFTPFWRVGACVAFLVAFVISVTGKVLTISRGEHGG